MEIKEFKFFHGITLHNEGIQNIIRNLRARLEMDSVNNVELLGNNERIIDRIFNEINNLEEDTTIF